MVKTSWSTRQLAELAGTTVKTVRHYHRVGLLDEPERSHNGYKHYQVAHLVRLMQITRMRELGLSLADIGAMTRADEDPDQALAIMDAELAKTIERLQRVRAALAVFFQHRAPLGTPAPFEPIAEALSERDRALIMIYSQVFDTGALGDLRELLGEHSDAEEELGRLPCDADESTIEALAQRLAPVIARHQARFPWMADPVKSSSKSENFVLGAIVPAAAGLYNTAQLRVLARTHEIVKEAYPAPQKRVAECTFRHP
ncbi:MerR family transcriptional regulator [Streptomyces halstedii]|uniref:MerR family transcriptional regulator n=1 Tax=Streptomyces halstedii TaxID=1944 RepID=A0A6N9U5F1_STRHA|nr:MerR family transcriptional regulator [Streptomyces halstedii]NEA19054.1 MerR family transcriptional regulator [Streptomyces halstedii]